MELQFASGGSSYLWLDRCLLLTWSSWS